MVNQSINLYVFKKWNEMKKKWNKLSEKKIIWQVLFDFDGEFNFWIILIYCTGYHTDNL